MEQILNSYYQDNAKKLHKVIDQIFYRKYGGTSGRDMDEFYSVANDVFADIIKNKRYDPEKGDFDGFLYGALELSIIDELKKQTRDKRTSKIEVEENINGKTIKRKIAVSDIYLDTPIGDNENLTIGDTLQSDFVIENEIKSMASGYQDKNVEDYLKSLSKVQREIIKMKMEYVPIPEIKKRLRLNDRQYKQNCEELKSFAKTNILFRDKNKKEFIKEDVLTMSTIQTMEKSKSNKLSIASIIKKIEKHTIRFDHPLQRESDQWTPSMKGNLVSDILQGNPIPSLVFAEQVVNGLAIIWDLDGKQRCTNAYLFSKDGYRITKNIRRWMIEYQAPVVDSEGKQIFDEDNFPVYERKEFDIRGKKFSELPDELQEKFNDYNFEIVQYLNCSSEDIAYHIARYNEGKPMTASQKGITRLGEEFAAMVKSISNMPFFKDLGGYKVSEFKNGTINRVIVESIMAANYLNDWKKKQEDICEYIKDNATSSDFDDFEEMVNRLEKVITEDTANMFDSKDSFLWFGLFARFVNTGEEDKRYIEFMAEFTQSLHSKKLNGVSFDDLNGKSTKDKNVVVGKMEHLEKLMNEYLGIKQDSQEEVDGMDIVAFVKENVDTAITQEDVEQYEEVLDELTLNVDNSSKLLDEKNRKSMIAIVAYSFQHDIDLDEWIVGYFKTHNMYSYNQEKNYLLMREDLDKFVQKGKREIA